MSSVDISILMPVYNAEKYLEISIESIRKQTFKNWELILVNDGSKDKSGQICDELAKQDNRIRVIHKANTGVSDTRNVLLDNAKGKYVGFVDSDDYIDPNMYELLYALLCKYNTDMCVCGIVENRIIDDKVVSSKVNSYHPKEFVLIDEMKSLIMDYGNSNLLNSLCNKLYKREIIVENNIKFNNSFSNGEDFVFNLEYMRYIRGLAFGKEQLYFYSRRQNSSITHQYVDDMYSKGLKIHYLLEEFLKDMKFYTEENQYILCGNHLMGVFSAILNLFHTDCPMSFKEKKAYIQDILDKDYVKECANKRKKDKGLIGIMSFLVNIKSSVATFGTFKAIALIRGMRLS